MQTHLPKLQKEKLDPYWIQLDCLLLNRTESDPIDLESAAASLPFLFCLGINYFAVGTDFLAEKPRK
ncbi:hypothetical protein [Neobacillus niacini]|uniref:hypothetical protein n=1 Tax=Neobacillus niacini TaxID=86668 RepID=UPI0021CB1763|nr:hypothetical protein [Neobacillus niacini]MCM3768088.1 hypothetical protein [Neobacillus niacini]